MKMEKFQLDVFHDDTHHNGVSELLCKTTFRILPFCISIGKGGNITWTVQSLCVEKQRHFTSNKFLILF